MQLRLVGKRSVPDVYRTGSAVLDHQRIVVVVGIGDETLHVGKLIGCDLNRVVVVGKLGIASSELVVRLAVDVQAAFGMSVGRIVTGFAGCFDDLAEGGNKAVKRGHAVKILSGCEVIHLTDKLLRVLAGRDTAPLQRLSDGDQVGALVAVVGKRNAFALFQRQCFRRTVGAVVKLSKIGIAVVDTQLVITVEHDVGIVFFGMHVVIMRQINELLGGLVIVVVAYVDVGILIGGIADGAVCYKLRLNDRTGGDRQLADDAVALIIADDHSAGRADRVTGGTGISGNIRHGAVLGDLAVEGDQAVFVNADQRIGRNVFNAFIIRREESAQTAVSNLCAELIGGFVIVELDLLGKSRDLRLGEGRFDFQIFVSNDLLAVSDGLSVAFEGVKRLAVGVGGIKTDNSALLDIGAGLGDRCFRSGFAVACYKRVAVTRSIVEGDFCHLVA